MPKKKAIAVVKSKPTADEKYRVFAEAYINTGVQAEAAKLAGYRGNTQSLKVTGSKLLKHPKVVTILAELRAEIKTESQVLCEELRVGTHEKRMFLWELAHDCRKIVREDEELSEHVDATGALVKIVRTVERVFRPREAIDCIVAMNEMDGDVPTGKDGGGKPGQSQYPPGMTIEQAVMTVIYGNNPA
jgi:hypothetical protein